MAFERKGSPSEINIISYDKSKEKDVACPECGNIIAKQENNILRFGSLKILGKVNQTCPKCNKEIII